MMKSFRDFIDSQIALSESKIELQKKLKEYTLTHLTGSRFKVESDDFQKEFSVEPYGKEILKTLPDIRSRLEEAITTLDVNKLYNSIKIAERVPYDYGNINNQDFSLEQIPDLSISLPDELKRTLVSSEKEFLYNNFSELNKQQKDSIINELRERAELLCVSIEALYYFRRLNDKTEYFMEMNWEEILETYQEQIEKSSKEASFSFEGPFDKVDTKNSVESNSLSAFWNCEKDQKKFYIFATVSPEKLHIENNVNGVSGLKFCISENGKHSKENDFNFFPISDLTTRIKLFLKHNKKK